MSTKKNSKPKPTARELRLRGWLAKQIMSARNDAKQAALDEHNKRRAAKEAARDDFETLSEISEAKAKVERLQGVTEAYEDTLAVLDNLDQMQPAA